MNLSLDSLKVQGFKSFTEPAYVSLARDVGLHFIRGANELLPQLGSNGSGKSTLWDALTWVLFGSTPNGLRNVDIRPWTNSVRTQVTLRFRIDDQDHVLTRTLDPHIITLDKKVIGQATLERTIGLSADLFCHTVLYAQSQPLFFDLSPRDKIGLLGSSLDLDRWDRRSQATAQLIKEKLEPRKAELERELVSVGSKIDALDGVITETTERLTSWAQEQRTLTAKVQQELDTWYKRLEVARERYADADLRYDSVMTEIPPLEKEVRHYGNAVFQNEARIRALEKIKPGARCPTCGQKVKSPPNHAHDLKSLRQNVKDFSAKLETCSDALTRFQSEAAKRKHEVEYCQTQVSDAAARIAILQNQLHESGKNPFREVLAAYKREQVELRKREKHHQRDLRILTRKIERRAYWVKAFKDIKLDIVASIVSELELTTNAMLADVGLVGWVVKYAVERETEAGTILRGLNVEIVAPGNSRDRVKWASFSGGECQRLRLVSAFALASVLLHHSGVVVNLKILDEPSAHLSEEGIDDLVGFLADRAIVNSEAILYTDHGAVESSQFSSVVTIVKDHDGSHVQ